MFTVFTVMYKNPLIYIYFQQEKLHRYIKNVHTKAAFICMFTRNKLQNRLHSCAYKNRLHLRAYKNWLHSRAYKNKLHLCAYKNKLHVFAYKNKLHVCAYKNNPHWHASKSMVLGVISALEVTSHYSISPNWIVLGIHV